MSSNCTKVIRAPRVLGVVIRITQPIKNMTAYAFQQMIERCDCGNNRAYSRGAAIMNDNQRKILMWVAAAIVAMLLYPPYVVRSGNTMVTIVAQSGYDFIFALPPRATVDIGTLTLQWVAVLIVGAIAFALMKDWRPRQDLSMREALRRVDADAASRRHEPVPSAQKKGRSDGWGETIFGLLFIVGWGIYYIFIK